MVSLEIINNKLKSCCYLMIRNYCVIMKRLKLKAQKSVSLLYIILLQCLNGSFQFDIRQNVPSQCQRDRTRLHRLLSRDITLTLTLDQVENVS